MKFYFAAHRCCCYTANIGSSWLAAAFGPFASSSSSSSSADAAGVSSLAAGADELFAESSVAAGSAILSVGHPRAPSASSGVFPVTLELQFNTRTMKIRNNFKRLVYAMCRFGCKSDCVCSIYLHKPSGREVGRINFNSLSVDKILIRNFSKQKFVDQQKKYITEFEH